MKTTAEEVVDGVVNMSSNKNVEIQVYPSKAETEATTWRIADKDCIVSRRKTEIYHITSNDQIWLKKELSIHLIKFELWWHAISFRKLRQTIK